MKKPHVVTLFLAAITLLLSGCGSSAITAGLAVELAGIERTETGATATLRYVNPNVAIYNIDRSEHKVYVDGALVGTISTKDAVGVPAQQAVTQDVALKLTKPLAPGEHSYRLESDCTLRLYADNMQGMKSTSSGSIVVK